jgi:hypothetical protein
MNTDMIKSELRRVVDQYFTQVSKGERDRIAAFIASAVAPAVRDVVGRSYQRKINEAVDQLTKAAKSLEVARSSLKELDSLARESLSRQVAGILFPDDFDPIGSVGAWTPLAYAERVEQFEKTLADFTQQVELTSSAIGGKTVRHGRGAPTKDGPRAVASHCLLVYQQYVGEPRHPSWNDYTSETYGGFYTFVKDIFVAAGMDASPEEMIKQAIKIAGQN